MRRKESRSLSLVRLAYVEAAMRREIDTLI